MTPGEIRKERNIELPRDQYAPQQCAPARVDDRQQRGLMGSGTAGVRIDVNTHAISCKKGVTFLDAGGLARVEGHFRDAAERIGRNANLENALVRDQLATNQIPQSSR